MATIRLNNTAENRYLKQVFDHLKVSHRDADFGYSDIPDPSPDLLDTARQEMASSDTIFLGSSSTMVKSHVMVLMKSLGLRESVALNTFSLTAKARDTTIELTEGIVSPAAHVVRAPSGLRIEEDFGRMRTVSDVMRDVDQLDHVRNFLDVARKRTKKWWQFWK
jgi:hypothetical protein